MLRAFGLFLALSAVVGCGSKSDTPKTAKVNGVVTYNGNPVKGATVTFANDKSPRAGTGITNDKGEFVLSTFGIDDGAIVGQHVATVTKQAAVAQVAQMKPEDYAKMMQGTGGAAGPIVAPGAAKPELPVQYSNSGTSPLKFTVEEGKQNQFKLELTD